MGEVFQLDHAKLARDARFAVAAQELDRQTQIDSTESFNRYCQAACRLLGRISTTEPTKVFHELSARVDEGGKNVIQTGWGGVVITLHEHPRVEKFLVIRKGGYLALEKHAEKDERLEVKEGSGLLLWRSSPNELLSVEPIAPRAQFHFEPGMEHCLIGTQDLLVFERSTDPKGMDQDLIFIYEPVR